LLIETVGWFLSVVEPSHFTKRACGTANGRLPKNTLTHRIGCIRQSLDAFDKFPHELSEIALQTGVWNDGSDVCGYAQDDGHANDRDNHDFQGPMALDVQITRRVAGEVEQVLNLKVILV
jgi:hypothetical protein